MLMTSVHRKSFIYISIALLFLAHARAGAGESESLVSKKIGTGSSSNQQFTEFNPKTGTEVHVDATNPAVLLVHIKNKSKEFEETRTVNRRTLETLQVQTRYKNMSVAQSPYTMSVTQFNGRKQTQLLFSRIKDGYVLRSVSLSPAKILLNSEALNSETGSGTDVVVRKEKTDGGSIPQVDDSSESLNPLCKQPSNVPQKIDPSKGQKPPKSRDCTAEELKSIQEVRNRLHDNLKSGEHHEPAHGKDFKMSLLKGGANIQTGACLARYLVEDHPINPNEKPTDAETRMTGAWLVQSALERDNEPDHLKCSDDSTSGYDPATSHFIFGSDFLKGDTKQKEKIVLHETLHIAIPQYRGESYCFKEPDPDHPKFKHQDLMESEVKAIADCCTYKDSKSCAGTEAMLAADEDSKRACGKGTNCAAAPLQDLQTYSMSERTRYRKAMKKHAAEWNAVDKLQYNNCAKTRATCEASLDKWTKDESDDLAYFGANFKTCYRGESACRCKDGAVGAPTTVFTGYSPASQPVYSPVGNVDFSNMVAPVVVTAHGPSSSSSASQSSAAASSPSTGGGFLSSLQNTISNSLSSANTNSNQTSPFLGGVTAAPKTTDAPITDNSQIGELKAQVAELTKKIGEMNTTQKDNLTSANLNDYLANQAKLAAAGANQNQSTPAQAVGPPPSFSDNSSAPAPSRRRSSASAGSPVLTDKEKKDLAATGGAPGTGATNPDGSPASSSGKDLGEDKLAQGPALPEDVQGKFAVTVMTKPGDPNNPNTDAGKALDQFAIENHVTIVLNGVAHGSGPIVDIIRGNNNRIILKRRKPLK
jgi:hypothetical protein